MPWRMITKTRSPLLYRCSKCNYGVKANIPIFTLATLCYHDISYGPVLVCLSQAGVISKRLDGSTLFFGMRVFPTYIFYYIVF